MLSSEADEDQRASLRPQSRVNRFSQYVRRAIRRRREMDEQDPTDPYMPEAASINL